VAVMIMVSIGTFSWTSLKNLRTHPKSSSIVMISTVVVVVLTHDLAKGVFVGVLLSSLFFAVKVSRLLSVNSRLESGRSGHRIYKVHGQVFFVSASEFLAAFDFKEVLDSVTIDLHRAHFWDISAVGALDKVVVKFRREGTAVELLGLNEASATIIDRLGQHNDPDALDSFTEH